VMLRAKIMVVEKKKKDVLNDNKRIN